MTSEETVSAWVVADDTSSGKRRAPRYFLVAATGPAQAIALVEQQTGIMSGLTLRGPASPSHLARRKMNLGDVCEIVGRQTAG
jgi:hypothetical protein